jgi:hypothetical protein
VEPAAAEAGVLTKRPESRSRARVSLVLGDPVMELNPFPTIQFSRLRASKLDIRRMGKVKKNMKIKKHPMDSRKYPPMVWAISMKQ